jgi:hypothetical protein
MGLVRKGLFVTPSRMALDVPNRDVCATRSRARCMNDAASQSIAVTHQTEPVTVKLSEATAAPSSHSRLLASRSGIVPVLNPVSIGVG